MASLTPRASGLWTSYFDADAEDDMAGGTDPEAALGARDAQDDGATPLDRTIDRIGMGTCADAVRVNSFLTADAGSYQWILLSLCGFGLPSSAASCT
jgi:hypothetical protein